MALPDFLYLKKINKKKLPQVSCSSVVEHPKVTSWRYFLAIVQIFKILLITYNAIHGLAPAYLTELITLKTVSRYSLRSSGEVLLQLPRIKTLRTLGDRSFTVAAPALWNNLPNAVRCAQSVQSFKDRLKTHLFGQAFDIY